MSRGRVLREVTPPRVAAELDQNSAFVDLGSGLGRPAMLAGTYVVLSIVTTRGQHHRMTSALCGVRIGAGVEVDRSRYQLSVATLVSLMQVRVSAT
jgi:hypothetical protein